MEEYIVLRICGFGVHRDGGWDITTLLCFSKSAMPLAGAFLLIGGQGGYVFSPVSKKST